jgi:hypothetical protein
MSFSETFRRALHRPRRLPASLYRTGRRSAVLGALLLAASTVTALATANNPPHIASATINPSTLSKGQSAVLDVSFTDLDPNDYHTVRVKWHDNNSGPHLAEVIQLPPGQYSFQRTHTFVGPVSGPSGSKVQVTVYDRQTAPGAPNDNTEGAGQDVAFVPVTVYNTAENLPPRFLDDTIQVTRKGTFVTVEGDVEDPDALAADLVYVTAAWNDVGAPGSPDCTVGLYGKGHFHCEHKYRPSFAPKNYTIDLTVKDARGGVDQHKVVVRGI